MNKDNINIPIINVKIPEKNLHKTYTDKKSTIEIIDTVAKATYKSFNEILRELVQNFIKHGQIYDDDTKKYYKVDEYIENYNEKKSKETDK